MHCARQNRAPDGHSVPRGLVFQRPADLLAYAPDKLQVKVPIRLTRGADADKRQLCVPDGLGVVVSGAQSARPRGRCDYLADIRFDDRGLASVYEVDFCADGIYADDLVTILREAPRGYRPDITQPKDANFQERPFRLLLFRAGLFDTELSEVTEQRRVQGVAP